jgi:hypothetical protein
VLDVASDGAPGVGATVLAGAGSASVTTTAPDAIGTSTPPGAQAFGLVILSGDLAVEADVGALLAALDGLLAPEGVLVAALGRLIPLPGEPRSDPEPTLAALRERFASVAVERRQLLVGSRAGAPSDGLEPEAGGSAVIVAASRESLPELGPVAALEDPESLGALFAALSAWEERARADEAEMAATRWEGRASAEKLTAVVNRLYELENTAPRRLFRRLRGGPDRTTHQGILRRASSDRGDEAEGS